MTRTLSATLTAVVLLAACGGERREGTATRSDSAVTGATPAAPTDSAARADSTGRQTGAAAPVDSAKAPSAATQPTASTDTGAKRPTASTAGGKKVAKQDTSKTAAAPSPPSATAQADQPLRDAYHQAPRDTVDQATYDGWKQFNLNCARCHGEDVLGTTIAPHLIVSLKPDGPINTKELFMQTVCAGRPAKGMPSWCALGMDMAKIQDIYAYVKGRSDAKIGPGRPAVKQGG
jgi:hypothetical protein